MQIQRLIIENFKSIERIELVEPNPFTVFVGPNGSGKSNIFEALEFVNLNRRAPDLVLRLFGGMESIRRRQATDDRFFLNIDFGNFTIEESGSFSDVETRIRDQLISNLNADEESSDLNEKIRNDADQNQFIFEFYRLFVGNEKLVKLALDDNYRLSLPAQNLEKVLRRILTNPILKGEIFEWLELFVPGFKAVEVDDRNELHWFESSSSEYFTKNLISDGTYNILALLTAVYQSDDEPQFLCIEEPENGLHPQILRSLVDFFRQQCKEKGHYIWLNTHSESLVRGLTTDEIILVNKLDGATQTRQIKGRNLYDLPTDEAWLTGALGGGLPW